MQVTRSTEPLRHTLGAIEAARDGRLQARLPGPVRYRTEPSAVAIILRPDFAAERWVDDGDSSEGEAAAVIALPIPR